MISSSSMFLVVIAMPLKSIKFNVSPNWSRKLFDKVAVKISKDYLRKFLK